MSSGPPESDGGEVANHIIVDVGSSQVLSAFESECVVELSPRHSLTHTLTHSSTHSVALTLSVYLEIYK